MSNTIKYTSKNGYTGILYGEKSLAVFDKKGRERMHTGFRTINTYDELVEFVEEFPDFMKLLCENWDEMYNDQSEDEDI